MRDITRLRPKEGFATASSRMFEVDMRSHLTNLIPPVGFESLYDLATAHETHYTQSYT
jgi:hypothetical protein